MENDNRTPAQLRAEADSLERLATERAQPLSRADLKGMSAEAIVEAKRHGRLDSILGISAELN